MKEPLRLGIQQQIIPIVPANALLIRRSQVLEAQLGDFVCVLAFLVRCPGADLASRRGLELEPILCLKEFFRGAALLAQADEAELAG